MRISTWAVNRIAEQQFAGDKARLDALRAKGKVLLTDVRKMQDEDIIDKLNSIGLMIDKEVMGELCINHVSAESLTMWLEKDRKLKLKDFDPDWAWLGVRVLWERWFPEIPNLEILDDKMQKGYELSLTVDNRFSERINYEALKVWGDTWDIIKNMMDKYSVNGLKAFDDLFNGTQSVYNWSMDYEMELANALVENLDYAQTRIDFCTEYIERYENKNEHNIKVMMSNVADTYFRLGNADKGDELFAGYLKDDPEWGCGWIGWSDQYNIYGEHKDTDKAIDILKQGLEVKELNDRWDVLDRLHQIYIDIGKNDEAESIMKIMEQVEGKMRLTQPKTFITEGYDKSLPYVVGNKIGRNDPCPCGSGKKYKKCCGKQD